MLSALQGLVGQEVFVEAYVLVQGRRRLLVTTQGVLDGITTTSDIAPPDEVLEKAAFL